VTRLRLAADDEVKSPLHGRQRSEWGSDAGVVADYVGAVRRIHHTGIRGAKARDVDRAEAANDLLRLIDLDHLVVELIADEGVAVGQAHRARRERRWIAARARVGDVLVAWNRIVVAIDFDDAAVVGVSDQGVAVGQTARESDSTNRAVSGKGLHDRARHGVRDLDGAVVVFVGDEDVAIG
jgi:hypothetical protein